MSWLQFGVDESDLLIPVEEVRRGKTDLKCPYCGGLLTAKKGKIMAWHFAHSEETCRQMGERDLPTLPYYHRFDLHLSGEAYKNLLTLWEKHRRGGFGQPTYSAELEAKGCIKENPYIGIHGAWQIDKLGKLAIGGLSLMLFCQIQEPKMRDRLIELENEVIEAKRKALRQGSVTTATLADALTDLRLYRAQYKRTLEQTLYLLEVKADGQTFHKIGVTEREVSDRIPEIRTELAKHFTHIEIKPLITKPHRGNVEFYFKWRYRRDRKEIGNLTEYFDFGNSLRNVKSDLNRMKSRELGKIEQGILFDDFAKVKRSLLTRAGMKDGKRAGREKEKPYQTLIKHPEVVKALEQGLSLRKTAEATGMAVNTVRRVKAAMEFKI
ncbi:competence protein CoiA family protein [Spirulina sp. CS-785/01]|uniref:competence protein CoiA family protein n=1 Tax=Spirulina sp. CS-785/01 TaxID=3021716 RepID=UPI00232F51AF|nr:competence protein CoiA family protein [Spirulina sp. CS-785/01]MDB9315641.1 competence protein CoiA family protein [Spirulina sp. CS-785/01]